MPSSSNSAAFTVATIKGSSLALDAAGNLYTGANGGVLKLVRTQGLLSFLYGGANQTASLLSAGNQAVALTGVSQSDTIDYTLTASSSSDCTTVASGLPSAIAIGGSCTLTAAYNPAILTVTTDTVTFSGNIVNAALSSPATVQLALTGPATPPRDRG